MGHQHSQHSGCQKETLDPQVVEVVDVVGRARGCAVVVGDDSVESEELHQYA